MPLEPVIRTARPSASCFRQALTRHLSDFDCSRLQSEYLKSKESFARNGGPL